MFATLFMLLVILNTHIRFVYIIVVCFCEVDYKRIYVELNDNISILR